MERTKVALMAYGLDSAEAERISKTYTVQKLKQQSMETLLSLGLPEEIAERLLYGVRPPIPTEVAEEVLARSAFSCCICHQPRLPVVIHHLDRWERSHSHDPDNLAVLCLNHHGEAHTHHENSRNLTAQVIRGARERWYAIVQERGVEAERALDTVRRYPGRWDYFNLSYILGFMDNHKISFDSRYEYDLLTKGLITENGMICEERLTKNGPYWLNFFDGVYLRRYMEEQLNIIIGCVPVRYIRDAVEVQDQVRPGELLLVDGRFYFKKLNKRTRGTGQTRKVRVTVGNLKFVGEFDAWYCNSSSSYSTHLTGNKRATMLCLVRDVKETDGYDFIDCTVVGLGLCLTQPDMIAQMMGGARDFSTAEFTPRLECERELDMIADLTRGQKEKEYYLSAPDVCDICRVSFRDQKYMVDGAVKPSGVGACMCPMCYRAHGAGIGWGRGQLYLHQKDRWLLVGGFYDEE